MVDYYAARAAAGLIVAEGAWPSAAGQAYCRQPGIVTRPTSRRLAPGDRRGACPRRAHRAAADARWAYRQPPHQARGRRDGGAVGHPAQVEIFTDAAGMQPCDTPGR